MNSIKDKLNKILREKDKKIWPKKIKKLLSCLKLPLKSKKLVRGARQKMTRVDNKKRNNRRL